MNAKRTLVAALVLTAGALALLTTPRSGKTFTSTNADTAMSAFVNVFWNPNLKYFYTNTDHQIHQEHAFGPQGGRYSDS